jgi:hypothetical protein
MGSYELGFGLNLSQKKINLSLQIQELSLLFAGIDWRGLLANRRAVYRWLRTGRGRIGHVAIIIFTYSHLPELYLDFSDKRYFGGCFYFSRL